jgi:GT2 family glycosyltransferase
MKINIIVVTYGKRFAFLEKTLNAVILDKRVKKIILVDNGSSNGIEIDSYIENHKDKIVLARNKENKGSAGGYKDGILEARKHKSDYVLLLDDDSVIENNWSDYFINALEYFPDKEHVVLKGNRHDNFSPTELPSENENVFRVDMFGKIKDLFKKTNEKKSGAFNPVTFMPHGAYSYSGTLLPFNAIVETELPFESFYLYYDDAEYLFRVKQSGYKAYQLYKPMIDEVDQTFSKNSEFLTSFDKKAGAIKTYFRIRNQYAIALMTKQQTKLSLFLNGILVIIGKIIYAFVKLGINRFTIERVGIIIRAFWNGVNLKFNTKQDVKKYAGR